MKAQLPWPRCMRAEKAAAYLDASKSHFVEAIAPELQAIHLGRLRRWFREDLDRWIEQKVGRVPDIEEPNPWDSPPGALEAPPAPRVKNPNRYPRLRRKKQQPG